MGWNKSNNRNNVHGATIKTGPYIYTYDDVNIQDYRF